MRETGWFILAILLMFVFGQFRMAYEAHEKRVYMSACAAPPIECAQAWEAKQ